MYVSTSTLFFLGPWVLAASRACAQDIIGLLLDPANDWSPNTTISSPGKAGFADTTVRWSVFAPPSYAASISPATEQDVAKAVRLATANNISLLATGGRHGFSVGLSKFKNGLAIDLSQLDTVKVNRDAGTVTVGGGTLTNQILDPVYAAGFQIPTGSCSCPGFVGVTLGGGVGRWSGVYGTISDALVSVRLVAADARILDVSEKTRPDLFWALRGAGANFGIVTSATYKLQKIESEPGQVVNADFIIPPSMVPEYFKALESYNGVMPAKLAAVSVVTYDQTVDAPHILANWVYMGGESEARKAMAPILNLSAPLSSINTIPWNQLLAVQGFGAVDKLLCTDDVIRNVYSTNVRNLSAAALESVWDKMSAFYAAHPGARGSALQLETFPNQAALAGSKAGAYPWRDAVGNFLFMFSWQAGDTAAAESVAKLGPEMRTDFQATGGYPGLSVSVNYAHGDEKPEDVYGRENMPELARLKRHWDPKNVFGFGHALPRHYP